jgi:hypothetical protein
MTDGSNRSFLRAWGVTHLRQLARSLSAAGNLPAVDKMVGPAPSFDVGYAGFFYIAQHRATTKGLVQ